MKTSQKKITREEFLDILGETQQIVDKKHPRSKIASYGNEFLKLNKKNIKAHQKVIDAISKPLQLELRLLRAKTATEKDGVLLLTDKNEYRFSSSGEQTIINRQEEINDKITEKVDAILDDEVEVICILDECPLPKDFSVKSFEILNEFVFKNEFKFED